MRKKTHQLKVSLLQKLTVWKEVVIISFVFLFIFSIITRAQVFQNPSSPAPGNPTALNDIADPSQFVELSLGTTHDINGPLTIATTTGSGAILGDFENNASLVGFSGISSAPYKPPALATYGVSGAAVYGYAGPNASVGAYGYAVGAGATGVYASAASSIATSTIGTNVGIGEYAGKYISLDVGTDGYPVIAFEEEINPGTGTPQIRVAHCLDVACQVLDPAAPNSINSLDKRPRSLSLTIDSDGRPVIFYAREDSGTDYKYQFVRCTDEKCTGSTTQQIDTSDAFHSTSLAVGSTDAYPIMSYIAPDGVNTRLHVAHCANKDCTALSPATPTIIDNTSGTTGYWNSIAIGGDDLPVMSYYMSTGDKLDLKVAHCTSADCSTSTAATIDSPGQVGEYTSIAISPVTGYPVISYHDATNGALKVAACADYDCVPLVAGSPVQVDDGGGGLDTGEWTSIAIPSDNLPAISYYDDTNDDLKFVKCGRSDCAGSGAPYPAGDGNSIVTLATDDDVGEYSSIAIGSDGLPIVAYWWDNPNVSSKGEVRIIHCANPQCTRDYSVGAGTFYGPFAVYDSESPRDGTLNVARSVTTPQLFASSYDDTSGTAAITAAQGLVVNGGFQKGITGDTDNQYGILGLSTTGVGFRATSTINSTDNDTYFGITATTTSATDGAGVYGWSAKGNGVVGDTGSNSILFVVSGKAAQSLEDTSSVFGSGGAFGAYFEGDVNMTDGSSKFCLGVSCFNEGVLQQLLSNCVAAGMCPDPYQ